MKQKGFITIIASLLILAIGSAGLIAYIQGSEERVKKELMEMGATIPVTVAIFETSLAVKISSSATTMTLTSASTTAGDDLSGYLCFAIDEGSASEEFVCGTASSTKIVSMIRGIDPVDGDLEVSSLKKAHRRGSSVKITNHPGLAIISRIINGDETFPNRLSYTATNTYTAGSSQIPDVNYVDRVATSGAAMASESVAGLVEIATYTELTIHSATGSTAAILMIPNEFVSSTSTASSTIVISESDGNIAQGYFDLEEDWTFAGTVISTYTTTTEDIGASSTTIPVVSTSDYPSSGTILIESEAITYATTNATNFGGAVRGVLGTSASIHTTSTEVENYSFFVTAGNTSISGDAYLSGNTYLATTTFSVIPTLPSATPTASYDASSKAYIDESIRELGSWATSSCDNAVTQATTDGYVVVLGSGASSGPGRLDGFTDGSNPPTTMRGTVTLDDVYATYGSFVMPVRKDDYWEINDDAVGVTVTILCHWIPLQ